MKLNIREQVLELYNKGYNNTEIQKELNYKSLSSISYYIKELGKTSNFNFGSLKENLSESDYKKLVDQIREYVNKGWSKNKIFKTLQISKSNLETIIKNEKIKLLNEKDINAGLQSHKTREEREKDFIQKLYKRDKTKQYLGGYVNRESIVTIRCLKCNSIMKITGRVIRHNGIIKCETCFKNEKIEKQQRIRQYKYNQKINKELEKILQSEQISMSICEQCGNMFLGNKKYCCLKCERKANNKRNELKKRKRINENGNADYTISLEKLIKRDNNICYLCGKECNLEDYTYQNNYFIAGNYYPSIEHVVPISKGGTHTWDNVRLAHRICNTLKGNK